MDYGKYRYELQKKEKEARKKQKVIEVKEIRLGIFTEEHDLNTKANRALKFLESGDKVKVSMRFRGREMGYANKGRETMLHFYDAVREIGTIEKHPAMEGRNMSMTLAPKTEKDREREQKEKDQIEKRKEIEQNGEMQNEVPSGRDEEV
jgi:translation initiation factor IF-3